MQKVTSHENPRYLLRKLQQLLINQIKLLRQGDIAGVDILSRQADDIVKAITSSGILEQEEFRNDRLTVEKLYQELCLVLTAQKDGTVDDLSRVRKRQQTFRAYHGKV